MASCASGVHQGSRCSASSVQHHKNEEQIPEKFHALWDEMRDSPVIRMESAARWNMNSKRMEAQARYGDILIAVGGTEGVRFLADLYHAAGKPVIPPQPCHHAGERGRPPPLFVRRG